KGSALPRSISARMSSIECRRRMNAITSSATAYGASRDSHTRKRELPAMLSRYLAARAPQSQNNPAAPRGSVSRSRVQRQPCVRVTVCIEQVDAWQCLPWPLCPQPGANVEMKALADLGEQLAYATAGQPTQGKEVQHDEQVVPALPGY